MRIAHDDQKPQKPLSDKSKTKNKKKNKQKKKHAYFFHQSILYMDTFFVQSFLVTSPTILQELKCVFSSVPCNTKFV